MFFSMLGWIVLAIVLGKCSLGYCLVMLNGLGQYNIGGVPNSFKSKVLILIGLCVVLYLWYQLFLHAPFSFSMD